MKFAISLFLLLSFVGIAVFGAFVMNHGGEHNVCIASTFFGAKAPCPQKNPLGFINFHLNALKSFSNAFVVFFALILVAGLGTVFSRDSRAAPSGFNSWRRLSLKLLSTFSGKWKFVYWLSLHETSPTFV